MGIIAGAADKAGAVAPVVTAFSMFLGLGEAIDVGYDAKADLKMQNHKLHKIR